MTPEQLQEIEKRAEAVKEDVRWDASSVGLRVWNLAHHDIPALIAEIRRLWTVADAAREHLDQWAGQILQWNPNSATVFNLREAISAMDAKGQEKK